MSNKFEDIAFENMKTFGVSNDRIQLVPFRDFRWEESVFEKIMIDFGQRNNINISGNI